MFQNTPTGTEPKSKLRSLSMPTRVDTLHALPQDPHRLTPTHTLHLQDTPCTYKDPLDIHQSAGSQQFKAKMIKEHRSHPRPHGLLLFSGFEVPARDSLGRGELLEHTVIRCLPCEEVALIQEASPVRPTVVVVHACGAAEQGQQVGPGASREWHASFCNMRTRSKSEGVRVRDEQAKGDRGMTNCFFDPHFIQSTIVSACLRVSCRASTADQALTLSRAQYQAME